MSKFWSIPKSPKQTMELPTKYVPGPGTYDPKFSSTQKKHPQFVQDRDKRFQMKLKNNLGPGSYNPKEKKFKKDREVEFMRRTTLTSETLSPGPGAYDDKFSSVKVRGDLANTMRSTKERNFDNGKPSPGQYNPKYSSTKRRPSSYYLPREPKMKFNPGNNPGAGDYQINDKLTSKHYGTGKFSEKPSIHQVKARKIPAVGEYNIANDMKKGQGNITFDGERGKIKNNNPAPGQYDVKHDIESWNRREYGSTVHPKRKRFLSANTISPSPNKYTPKKAEKNLTFTINPKQLYSNANGVPGPGSYNTPEVEKFKKKTGAQDFTNLPKPHNRKEKQTLGPGSFNVSGNMNKRVHDFGRAPKGLHFKSNTPGPGSYNLTPDLADIPGYIKSTLKGRLET